MEVRSLHQDTITPADAMELARLRTVVDPRRLRSDPPVGRDLAVNELRPSVSTFVFEYFGLFDGPHMVGVAETSGAFNAENADVCEVGLWIDPERHGQGLHRHLFDHVDAIERARGRVRYWGWGDLADEATRSFWETELGYTLAYDERISRCDLASVDSALMQQWIDQATERASGYELVRAQAPFNDELIGYFAQALEAMDDAPLATLCTMPRRSTPTAPARSNNPICRHSPTTELSSRERRLPAHSLVTRPCVFPKRNLHSRNRATR